MKENTKSIIGVGFSIIMLIIVLISLVYTVCMLNEKTDMRIAEKKKEESMRYKLVSEKLNEPKDSFYIDKKEGNYMVITEKGEYIVDYDDNYSKIEHFVKVGPKKNE
ncbi:hypothetical protein UP12_19595 (plasmid) [Bacillus pumilus]|uniref:hypothetical protein n=1 Tax=Bacillus pumilus TaxID=1408 RepID=UPI0007766896|nr:hypothetical protein [Bacillus pumilus]AMM99609.1 hypothetical protein UP12_19595 [Bacillus pumilus]